MFCKKPIIKETELTELVLYKSKCETVFSKRHIHTIQIKPTINEKKLFSIYKKILNNSSQITHNPIPQSPQITHHPIPQSSQITHHPIPQSSQITHHPIPQSSQITQTLHKSKSHNIGIIPYIIPNYAKTYPYINSKYIFSSVFQICNKNIRSYKKILETHTELDQSFKNKIKNRIQQIYILLTYFIDNYKKLSKSLEKTNQCPICLSDIENGNKAFTLCCHIFCFTCIIQHLEHKKNCPMCRRDAHSQYIFRYNNKKNSETNSLQYGSKIKYLESLLDFWKKREIYTNIILFCCDTKIKKLVYKVLKSKYTIHKKIDLSRKYNSVSLTKKKNTLNIFLVDSKNLLDKTCSILCESPIILLDEELPSHNTENRKSNINIYKKSTIYHLSYK